MAGDLEGAPARWIKWLSWQNHSAKPTNANESGETPAQEQEIYRQIEVRTLGDPTPEELDNLMEKLIVDPSIRAAAASLVAK